MTKRIAVLILGMALLTAGCTTTQFFDATSPLPRIQFEGDSITWQATDAINARFGSAYDVAIDAMVGTDTYLEANQVRAQVANHPDVEVINLGTNDAHGLAYLAAGGTPGFEGIQTLTDVLARLDVMAGEFPTSTCVVFVTVNSHNPSWGPTFAQAIDAHERAMFAHIADWDQASTPSDFGGVDDPHPNATGRQHLLDVIQHAVDAC